MFELFWAYTRSAEFFQDLGRQARDRAFQAFQDHTLDSAAATQALTAGSGGLLLVTNTATNGTAAWVTATQAASNAVTIASGTVAFFVPATSLADPLAYIKCSVGASGLVQAIFTGLYAQRKPANLAALQAGGITASPLTAWTTGQSVNLGTGSAHWDGSAYAAGIAP